MTVFRSKVLLLSALVLAGCGSRSTSTSTAKSDDAPAAATSDDVLTSAVYQLKPDNFGLNSNPDKPVSLLNSWRTKEAAKDPSVDQPSPVKAPDGWIAAENETRLAQARFDVEDAVHVRDALLYHTVAGFLSDRGQDEVQRISTVVDYVSRNVSLWKDDDTEIPLIAFASLQLGKGSPDSRAWICAQILRQLRIDSVILRAKSDAKETSDKWLLGVLLDKGIFLFDLQLGLPVANGDIPDGKTPATLKQIGEHPEWLEQMAVNEPYRLKADDLKDPNVYVMDDPEFWCKRMSHLEQALPTSASCILYDPLLADDGQSGLLHRVANAGGWELNSVKLWPFPKRQNEAAAHPTPAAAQEFQRLVIPLSVPIPVHKGEDGKMAPGTPERKLQRYRTDQMLGRFTEATQRYLSIRHLEVEPNPPDLELLNRLAAEDASYWTAICKFELNDYLGAVDQLTSYLKKYDRKGKWYFPARSLLAQSYAGLGQLPEAIKTLERMSSDDPYRSSNVLRVQRWSAAKKAE